MASELSAPARRVCLVCTRSQSQYTCPACNVPYCSSACFKVHDSNCTESFYKRNILAEMGVKEHDEEGKQKVLSVLARQGLVDTRSTRQEEEQEEEEEDITNDDEVVPSPEEQDIESRLNRIQALSLHDGGAAVKAIDEILTPALKSSFLRAAVKGEIPLIRSSSSSLVEVEEATPARGVTPGTGKGTTESTTSFSSNGASSESTHVSDRATSNSGNNVQQQQQQQSSSSSSTPWKPWWEQTLAHHLLEVSSFTLASSSSSLPIESTSSLMVPTPSALEQTATQVAAQQTSTSTFSLSAACTSAGTPCIDCLPSSHRPPRFPALRAKQQAHSPSSTSSPSTTNTTPSSITTALSISSVQSASPLLPHHLVNIVFAYAHTMRLYGGDWSGDEIGAACTIASISLVLSQDQRFSTTESALASAIEASQAPDIRVTAVPDLSYPLRIVSDVAMILQCPHFLVDALTHVYVVFMIAAQQDKEEQGIGKKGTSSVSSLDAVISDGGGGARRKNMPHASALDPYVKKLLFFTSWAFETFLILDDDSSNKTNSKRTINSVHYKASSEGERQGGNSNEFDRIAAGIPSGTTRCAQLREEVYESLEIRVHMFKETDKVQRRDLTMIVSPAVLKATTTTITTTIPTAAPPLLPLMRQQQDELAISSSSSLQPMSGIGNVSQPSTQSEDIRVVISSSSCAGEEEEAADSGFSTLKARRDRRQITQRHPMQ